MGLFGSQPRQEPIHAASFEDEEFDELPSLPQANTTTTVAQGITVTGVLRGEGSVQIEGRLDGEIDLRGGVTITPTGVVQGPITADTVRVAGSVKGKITAREQLRLERTGAIHGDVSTASLIVENGRLNGSSAMLAPAEPSKDYESDISVQSLRFGPNFELMTQED